jgi:trehalose synthase
VQQIQVQPVPLDMLKAILAPAQWSRLVTTAAWARAHLAGRVVWNVNATAHGGGVAEMLQSLLAYARGAGVDARWLVLDGDLEFFAITKRVHNALHGSLDGGQGFGVSEHEHYEQVLERNLVDLAAQVRPGDIVLLHDPQTAGLVEGLHQTGAHVIWRSHIGRDDSTADTDSGWEFLRGYLTNADAFVFSRSTYVQDWVASNRVRVIAPSIDPFSTKNRELDAGQVCRVLRRAGLIAGRADGEPVDFTRRDGTVGVVRQHRDLLSGSEPPPADAPLVVQVSRWDRLKDMAGVLAAFADYVAPASPQAHLMLAGPDVSGVSDDPEGAEVLAACRAAWAALPEPARKRCHLACIPMDDADENAIIINALQRHAAVVVQKSLFEGFGLTVSEALWKSRPVLASAVGGIQDQIVDGQDGLLLPDPRDLVAFAQRLQLLLDDPSLGERLGRSGHERVRDHFLGDRSLIQYVDLFDDLIEQNDQPAAEWGRPDESTPTVASGGSVDTDERVRAGR